MFQSLLTIIPLIGSFGIAVYSLFELRRAKNSIPSLEDLVWEEGEGENKRIKCDARLGLLVQWLSDTMGSRMAHSLKQSLYQSMGVDAKLEKNFYKAVGEDVLDNSGIGGLLDLVGMTNVRKQLANNPKTINLVMPFIQKLLQGKKGVGGGIPQGMGAGWGRPNPGGDGYPY